jgi:hypothetical protein
VNREIAQEVFFAVGVQLTVVWDLGFGLALRAPQLCDLSVYLFSVEVPLSRDTR